jgi:hypothetical protein
MYYVVWMAVFAGLTIWAAVTGIILIMSIWDNPNFWLYIGVIWPVFVAIGIAIDGCVDAFLRMKGKK